MYPKFNLSRTRIVILTLVCTMVCAVAVLVAFGQWSAKKTTAGPVDTTARPSDSSETEAKRGVDGLKALRAEEASKPLKQETHPSPAEERLTTRSLINPFKVTPLSNNGWAAWLPAEKHLEKLTPFNQSLSSPLDGTATSAGIADLTEPVLARSTARVAERQSKDEDREEDKARGDHPDEAVRFRNLQMQDENGKIPIDGLQKAREQVARMLARQQKKAKAAGKPEGLDIAGINPGAWAWLGPGNIGGRIRSIVIDPVDPNKMFIGSVSGGIWRSANGGAAWSPVNDFLANLAVSTMVIDPTNPNTLYAGTGESYAGDLSGNGFSPDFQRGDGVFKSIDGGTTWTQLASTNTALVAVCPPALLVCQWSFINRLTISPDGSTILAGTEFGIMRSVDGGTNWSPRPAGLTRYPDIDFDPTNSQRAIAAGYGASVFSIDGGQSWQNATYNPPLNAATLGGSTGRVEMAYAPSNSSIVYAMIDATQGAGLPPPGGTLVKGNLYKSLDWGATFTLVNASNPGNTFLGGQGNYGNIIWVNPQDPNFIIVGGINMYLSTDGGTNWTGIADGRNGSAHSDHHMIVADPGFNNNTNKRVYFSNDGGIYKTDDVSSVSLTNGWTNLNNFLGVTQFYGAAVNTAGAIVGGTQDNGTLRYTGDAQAWTSMFGGDGGFTAADPADNNYFYGEYTNLGIVRSTDAGSSSGYIYCNPAPTDPNGGPCVAPATGILDSFNGANFIAPFILDPNEPNRMLAGGLSLWRSNDIKAPGLPTWSAVKPPVAPRPTPTPPGPAPTPTPLPTPPISAITVSKNNSDFIVVGHNDGQLYLTFDGTSAVPTWSPIDAGIPAMRFVTRIVLDETKGPNWIYVTLGGFAADNIYRSIDLGATWTDITGPGATGLPNVPVRDLAISPANPMNLYAATEIGIFASEDAGATWGLPQDGPANVAVDQLIWINGSLGAVTHGRGLYKTSNPVFGSPICVPPTFEACNCYGQWNCPCTWNLGRVPTVNDDIAISCPVVLSGSPAGSARNMGVYSDLTLDNDFGAIQDVINFGNIHSNFATRFGSRNLSNSRRPNNTGPLGGIIRVGEIRTTGSVTNSGIITVTGKFESGGLTTAPDSGLSADHLRVLGHLENYGRVEALGTAGITVQGNVDNGGLLKAPILAISGSQHNFSGSGMWQFGAFVIPGGFSGFPQTVSLNSDVAFDIANFSVQGTLDVRDKTLTLKGSNFSTGTAASVLGTGTIRLVPATGNAIFGSDAPNFKPTVTIASGNIECQSAAFLNALNIDAGATLALNFCSMTTNGAVVNDGAITRLGSANFNFNGQTFTNNGTVGNIDFFTFNNGTGPPVQFVSGIGSWSPANINVGAPTRLNLGTNVTFATNQLITATGASINVGSGLTLAMTGPTNFFRGRITGTGLVKIQPSSGSPQLGTNLTIDPTVEIASGTVRAIGTIFNGKLIIDSGSTFSLLGSVEANGDFENNGTLNVVSDSQLFNFKGSTFTNNGSVTGNVFVNFGSFFGPPLVQNLAGTGSWAGSPRLFIDSLSTTTLLNDFTYNGGNLFVQGRLNTGAFTLSLPCTVTWSGAGDVIGNVRRTNLAACPGAAIAFGSPFTTIQFTSGTPPTEITVNVGLGAPAGFLNAARRTYVITPTGGNGYTATLRLHYLDSELNGNAESTLQLWRNDGSNWTPQGATNRNTTENWVEYNNVTQFSPWTMSGPSAPTAAPAIISGEVKAGDGTPLGGVLVTLNGSRSSRAITNSSGVYSFDDVEVGGFYTVTPSRVNYSFSPSNRSFSLLANVTDAVFIATASGGTANALDTTEFFVRQHYLDFLGREPDQSGLNFWTNNIELCGANQTCRAEKRIDTSAAFFLSIEFQQTGFLVERVYQSAFNRFPSFSELIRDTQEIGRGIVVGQAGWEAKLEANKTAFMAEFVARTDFIAVYGGLSNEQYVDALNANTATSLSASDRNVLVAGLNSNTETRATVLRKVAENATFTQREFNRAFVLMQYFGYLRRNPNDPPDEDFTGYNFWLNKLNSFGGDFRQAEMVKAFITSTEYRGRFGQP